MPTVPRTTLLLLGILGAQAAWSGWLSSRGWFYQDDLSALDESSGRRLNWSFLTTPVNDHLVPGYRLVFWLQRHTSPLAWGPTVIARVALQTLAVYLLYRLLRLFFGDRPAVLAFTALYAFNPLIVSNLTWLTTAACLVPAQLAAIVAIHQHARYTLTGRLRSAAAAGVALLVGMCFWEKTAVIGLLLPVLSLGFLSTGSVRQRLRALVRRWPGWILTAAPPLAFVAYFLANHYGGSARGVSAGDLVHAIKVSWLRMATPAMFGGPWRWFDTGTAYVSWSSPPRAAVILCQLAFVALVVAAWRRTGARSLLGWSIPAISVAVGTAMVAVGRYFAFGDLISVTMRYSFDFALALTLGTALALVPSTPDAMAARIRPRRAVPPGGADSDVTPAAEPPARRRPRLRPALVAVTAATLVASSLVSAWRFQTRWEKNPTKPYVDNLMRNIEAAGPSVNLYDTSVSNKVVPYFFGPTLHLSQLLDWSGAKVRFDKTNTAPMLVDQDGNLRAASIIPAAFGILQPGQMCEALVQGVGTWRVPLTTPLEVGEGFLRLEYFQQRPSTLSIQIEDRAGALVDPVGGNRVLFPVTLGAQLFRLKSSSAAAVIVTSHSAAANVCVGNIVIGAPFAPAAK